MKKLTFDIMVGDKFYKTMRMPIEIDTLNFDGSVNEEKGKGMGITKMSHT